MINTVLIAIDGSGHATRALNAAAELAARFDARLVLLTVWTRGKGSAELADYARSEGQYVGEVNLRILDQAEEVARQAGVKDIIRLDDEGDPAASILRTIMEHGVDLVVMGSRGLSPIKEILLGSVSQKVVHLAPCACMIVR